MSDIVLSAVLSDREAAESVVSMLPSSERTSLGSVRALDGTVGEWLVLATVAVNAVVPALAALRDLIEAKRVKSIKIGDVEINNPSREQADRLLELYEARLDDPRSASPDDPHD